MKVVDTDIFIDLFRGFAPAIKFFSEHADEIVFSSITEAELLAGQICNDATEKERVLHVLGQFEKIPADNPLVQIAGEFRRKYGCEIPDALIAASAFLTASPLVTRNIADFQRIKGIMVEKPY
ncbi:type II toxin-antitoxin system VapC family toxin [Candidatus Woesearchaeota archaeon]|nr:type II toxin-antitoxin system VapC family toxin [Candidatus Woesearchaeota archaeon]